MATTRQPAARPAHPTTLPSLRRLSSTKSSRKNSAAIAEGGTAPQAGVENDQEESQREPIRQAVFQRRSNQALKLPNGYLKVAVLIMRWDESIDDFKGHTEEINRLQEIFEGRFGYECKVYSITNLKKPQVELNLAIMNHVHEYDDPNNLLIFYYTGHGDVTGDDLELSANQDFSNTNGRHLPTAFWNRAEHPIRYDMEGDALSILDCCMASTAAMKCRNGLPRTYQLLAAAAAGAPTCGPGQNSFTTALCDSLQELLIEANGGTFLLTQLCERINTKRKAQACLSWDRLQAFKRTVQLGRLEQAPNLEDSFCNEEPELSSLYLRLSFKKSDLENDQIERLAEQLPHACHEAKVLLRRIDWVRMTTTKQKPARIPRTHHDMSFRDEEGSDLEDQAGECFDADGNNAFDPQTAHLYKVLRSVAARQRWQSTLRTVNATQNATHRWQSIVRRKHDNKVQLLKDRRENLPYISAWMIYLKLSSLLLIFGLLFFREDSTGLILWGVFVALMLVYGPCRVTCIRRLSKVEIEEARGVSRRC